jgi:hypothetical protein
VTSLIQNCDVGALISWPRGPPGSDPSTVVRAQRIGESSTPPYMVVVHATLIGVSGCMQNSGLSVRLLRGLKTLSSTVGAY